MRADTQLHNVTKIELTPIKRVVRSEEMGGAFYCRYLVVTMSDGTTENIDLFSDDGYSLLVDDSELAAMKAPIQLAA